VLTNPQMLVEEVAFDHVIEIGPDWVSALAVGADKSLALPADPGIPYLYPHKTSG